ncbi:type I phosphomannose isomerase catalytic subunit [Paenibacillus yanchengensis]|uniref:Mannose-6-phosphate isomerase n=1 Tax=Paenibacillus yanchengensis TaxID=2035833 RepID=A0ABW4YFF6_9BACL
MIQPYPLRFTPLLKERVWGGNALERFGLQLPNDHIGEGWMIADHPNGVTTVENGPLAGKGLDEIRQTYGQTWFGTNGSTSDNGRFPLLIKLLDCNDDLSVQVHPTNDYQYLPEGELGKTEMWYVLDAKPGAHIIYGLQENITRDQLEAAINNGTIMDTLNTITVKTGDAFYIPAGTVHALCSGIVVAEIQQNSDTTYRLYDYNRPGLDGQLRELHIEDSLNVIAYDGAGATYTATTDVDNKQWLEIAASPYFTVHYGKVTDQWQLQTPANSCVILVIATGEGNIIWGDQSLSVTSGQCLLLPATLGYYQLTGTMTVLQSTIPNQ